MKRIKFILLSALLLSMVGINAQDDTKKGKKEQGVPEISFVYGDAMKSSWTRGWLDLYYSLNYNHKAPFNEKDWVCISDEIGDATLGLHDPNVGGTAVNSAKTGWKQLKKLAGKKVTFAFKGYAAGKGNVSAAWDKFSVRVVIPDTDKVTIVAENMEPERVVDSSDDNLYTWQKVNNCWRYTNKTVNKNTKQPQYGWAILPTVSF